MLMSVPMLGRIELIPLIYERKEGRHANSTNISTNICDIGTNIGINKIITNG